ncbi:MAG: class I SAM-dependent methyltransferase [bacterium]
MENNYYQNKKGYKINKFRRNAILKLLGKRNLVLDVGCGEGFLGEEIKKKTSAVVYGIDVAESVVDLAKNKLDEVFCSDIEKNIDSWPENIKTKKFDIIIVSEVLEHLFYPEKLLDDLRKVLKKDGEIIITVPNILFWKNRIKILFGIFDYKESGLMDRGHIHFFTWQSLKKMLGQGNFTIVEIKNHVPTRYTKFFGCCFPGMFAYQFIIKVKLNED